MNKPLRIEVQEILAKCLRESKYGSCASALFTELYFSVCNEEESVKTLLENVEDCYDYQNTILIIKEKKKMGLPLSEIEQNFVEEYPYEVYE